MFSFCKRKVLCLGLPRSPSRAAETYKVSTGAQVESSIST